MPGLACSISVARAIISGSVASRPLPLLPYPAAEDVHAGVVDARAAAGGEVLDDAGAVAAGLGSAGGNFPAALSAPTLSIASCSFSRTGCAWDGSDCNVDRSARSRSLTARTQSEAPKYAWPRRYKALKLSGSPATEIDGDQHDVTSTSKSTNPAGVLNAEPLLWSSYRAYLSAPGCTAPNTCHIA